jgi:hypothetical protein
MEGTKVRGDVASSSKPPRWNSSSSPMTEAKAWPTPQGEVPATGREVALRFAVVVRGDVELGQARSVHLYFDQLEFLGQLGLIPEPAAA